MARKTRQKRAKYTQFEVKQLRAGIGSRAHTCDKANNPHNLLVFTRIRICPFTLLAILIPPNKRKKKVHRRSLRKSFEFRV